MSRFDVLNARVPEELARWDGILAQWQRPEVYAYPGYLKAFAAADDTLMLIRFEDASGICLYPLVRKAVSTAVESGDVAGASDVFTPPFGYGGPFVVESENLGVLHARFFESYSDWLRTTDAISEYTTFDPTRETGPYPGVVVDRMPVVLKPVNTSTIFDSMHRSVRKACRRAVKLGVSVDVYFDDSACHDFLRIYDATGERHGGFAREYQMTLHGLHDFLKSIEGRWAIFHASDADGVVSTELVLLSGDTVVSFRGGTLSDKLETRANQLLRFEIARWAGMNGFRWYLLGGGARNDSQDPIFKYKSTFMPNGVVPLRVGKWVVDSVRYRRLMKSIDLNWRSPNFGARFPEYRFMPRVQDE